MFGPLLSVGCPTLRCQYSRDSMPDHASSPRFHVAPQLSSISVEPRRLETTRKAKILILLKHFAVSAKNADAHLPWEHSKSILALH